MLSASGSNLRRGRIGKGIECVEVPKLKEGHISPIVWTPLKLEDTQAKMGKTRESEEGGQKLRSMLGLTACWALLNS